MTKYYDNKQQCDMYVFALYKYDRQIAQIHSSDLTDQYDVTNAAWRWAVEKYGMDGLRVDDYHPY